MLFLLLVRLLILSRHCGELIGLRAGWKVDVPLIVDESLLKLEPCEVWAGGILAPMLVVTRVRQGGHVDWKLLLPLRDFVARSGCFVAPVTQPPGQSAS